MRGAAISRVAVLALAISTVSLQGGHSRPTVNLEVVSSRQRVVWRATLEGGERFDLSWLHSAERCRWVHHYRAQRWGIEQLGSSFGCLGAGMPALAGEGTLVRTTPHGYTVSTPAMLGELAMMNWRPSDVTLQLRGRRVRVGALLDDFESFRLQVR